MKMSAAYSTQASRKWRSKNPERFAELQHASYQRHAEKRRKEARDKRVVQRNNPEWVNRYRKYTREKAAIRIATDPLFALKKRLRGRIKQALSMGYKKACGTEELIGCTISDFKLHIESLWLEGMNWENHGIRGWHIDHKIPLISFDLSNPEQQKIAFNYKNTQPLWAYKNLQKGSKIMTLNEQIKNELPKLQGWTSWERGVEMAELIIKKKPLMCVELGVFGGRSLIAQALALKENGIGQIFGIDPWKVEAAVEGENSANADWWTKNVDLHEIHKGAMEALWRLELDKWAVVIQAKSQDAAGLFLNGIDWLLIDGNHSEVASCRDVDTYLPKVTSEGIIIFDDADWPSTQKALKMLDRECDLLRDAKTYRIYQKR